MTLTEERAATASAPSQKTDAAPKRPWRHRLSRFDQNASPYFYISPFFLLFGLVGLFPLLYTVWVAVHEWDLLKGEGDFVGVGNFVEILGDSMFWNSIGNTLSIFLLSAIPQLAVALTIAYLLDRGLRAPTFWRMSVLIPFVVTPVAVAIIFSSIFNEADGLANNLLNLIGIADQEWKHNTALSHIAIAVMVNFRWTGYNALIFLAAMQAIPRDYYEAAMIDGAGRLRRFFSITIPQLRPTIIFVVVTSTIGGLQIFDEPRLYDVYGRGGADQQWLTLTMYIYELGWTQQDFGRAAAVAWLLFLVIIIFGALNLALTRTISSGGSRASKGKSKVKVAK